MNDLTEADFRKIIARRDSRYDGRFLFGVRTTKIYCRIMCPARPKPENIVIFKSPSEAERSGFRPCLRCHPDAAPGSSILNGTSNTVARALRLIEESDDLAPSVEKLAARLGVTDRHLRRLFEEHLGASPIEIMITKRLHLAKRLIIETEKPLSEIAFAVGFQSIRRFNDAFKNLFDQPPTAFRAKKKTTSSDIELSLMIRPPYDWSTVLAYLKRHEAHGIEFVDNDAYTRFLVSNAHVGTMKVTRGKKESELRVRVAGVPLTEIRKVLTKLRNLFDTEHNPLHLPKTKELKPNGVRVPGSFDGFEVAVSIILSQLVSTVQAKETLKKLILRFGHSHGVVGDDGGHDVFSFPTPNQLQNAPLEELGLTKVKASAIRELARALHAGEFELTPGSDFQKTRDQLQSIKGIGPWTVELIAMRCLGDPNAFPSGDLIVRRALEAKVVNDADWSSSRAYLTHCLWRDSSTLLKKTKERKV